MDTGKSILGQNFVNRVSNIFWFFFNGSLLDYTIDFDVQTEQPYAVVENKSIMTALSNCNRLQKSPSLLPWIEARDSKSRLKEIKAQSSDKLILGHLNINSIRNKFEALKFIIEQKIYTFMMSEIKLDDSFLTAQFLSKGFSTLTDLIKILKAIEFSCISVKIYHLNF